MSTFLVHPELAHSMTLTEKVGQFFQPAAFINDSEAEIQKLENLIREHHIGSICFFHSRASAATNFEGKKQIVHNEESLETLHKLIARYQKAAKYPLLISIDAEWGLAMRIENTLQLPYAVTLGALADNDLIRETGKRIGEHCLASGIHWNLAPVVDVNSNPNNPVIGYRSFGNDPKTVTEKAAAFLQGTKDTGVLNSLKHFPGHGDTATDSHLGLPVIAKTKTQLLREELYPFAELIKTGVDSVMIGHLSVPALDPTGTPATLSKPIIKDVLQDELEFNGVVISDALNMHAVSKDFEEPGSLELAAFEAGNDILCFAEHVEAGISRILASVTQEEIEHRFQKVWELKCKAQVIQKEHQPLDTYDSKAFNTQLAEKSLTELRSASALLPEKTSGSFTVVTVGKPKENVFVNGLARELQFDQLKLAELPESFDKPVLIALFPPKAKPADYYGLGETTWNHLHELIATGNGILYLFGNPYLLEKLPHEQLAGLTIVYQDFPEFQEIAANHFLGKHKAVGQFPLTLSS
ncbi:glycoside hydrolase family 3 protein [Sediminicola luteus]|uniref:beta-N-acetylhexosaminidase n=1 Tax=Sediminicola luteus TaxID=319238 RepID=A0A2A4GAP4_9FLAO|nr:glycoside hydrolase family 3 protein [Sediminicola luteus]PCE64822.1 glycoside hydrolase [Sediminicola luteus]